ncbi:unnamed protein product, partial [Heterosigma akashiwo]
SALSPCARPASTSRPPPGRAPPRPPSPRRTFPATGRGSSGCLQTPGMRSCPRRPGPRAPRRPSSGPLAATARPSPRPPPPPLGCTPLPCPRRCRTPGSRASRCRTTRLRSLPIRTCSGLRTGSSRYRSQLPWSPQS